MTKKLFREIIKAEENNTEFNPNPAPVAISKSV
jgi:hypothetical protein